MRRSPVVSMMRTSVFAREVSTPSPTRLMRSGSAAWPMLPPAASKIRSPARRTSGSAMPARRRISPPTLMRASAPVLASPAVTRCRFRLLSEPRNIRPPAVLLTAPPTLRSKSSTRLIRAITIVAAAPGAAGSTTTGARLTATCVSAAVSAGPPAVSMTIKSLVADCTL